MKHTAAPVTGTEQPVTVSRWSRTASGSTGVATTMRRCGASVRAGWGSGGMAHLCESSSDASKTRCSSAGSSDAARCANSSVQARSGSG